MNEEIVATVGGAVSADSPTERELRLEASVIEQRAEALEVVNDFSYAAAGEYLKEVKKAQKMIKDYWEPLRVSAKKTYDDVLSKKKEMLDSIDRAEKVLKRKMGSYVMEQERAARELEEKRRREAETEIAKKLEQAVAMESKGDYTGADNAMAEAEVYDQYAASITVQAQNPKVSGISTSKTWKINVISPAKVPISLNGVILRPIDEAAILRLVKAAKGQITIPGVEITEDVVMNVRV